MKRLRKLMYDPDVIALFGFVSISVSIWMNHVVASKIICSLGFIITIYAFFIYRRIIKRTGPVSQIRINGKVWTCTIDYRTNEYVYTNTTTQHKFPVEEYSLDAANEELMDSLTPKKLYPFKRN